MRLIILIGSAFLTFAYGQTNFTGIGYALRVYSCANCSGSVTNEVFGTTQKCVNLNLPGYAYVRITCYQQGFTYGVSVFTNPQCTMLNTNIVQPLVAPIGQCINIPTTTLNGRVNVPPNFQVDCNINVNQLAAVVAETVKVTSTTSDTTNSYVVTAATSELNQATLLLAAANNSMSNSWGAVLLQNATLQNLTSVYMVLVSQDNLTITQEQARTAVYIANQTLTTLINIYNRRVVQYTAALAIWNAKTAKVAAAVANQGISAAVLASAVANATSTADSAVTAVSSGPCINNPCKNGGSFSSPLFSNCSCTGNWVGRLCDNVTGS